MLFLSIDQKDEETWYDKQEQKDKDRHTYKDEDEDKKVLKNTKNMTPNSCSVLPEKFHPHVFTTALQCFEDAEIEVSLSE